MNARRRKVTIRAGAVICVLALFLLCQPPPALPQAPFYQGKTITVIAGQEPGGLGDLRLKSILPYLKKHIPGQPNIVPEYMPGGGGPMCFSLDEMPIWAHWIVCAPAPE